MEPPPGNAADGLPTLQTRRASFPTPEPVMVAADANDPWWKGVAPVELQDNLGGSAPAQATRIRTAWDGRTWCVLFEADDARPWATLTDRDGPLWTEEVVEVFIDPVGDLESYFEIEINPLGTVCDLILRRTSSGWRKEFAWNVAGLVSHARPTPTGWAAELAIPFDALTLTPPQPGTRWRVNFLRIDRPGGEGTDGDLSAWSPTGMRNFHRPERFGTVEFVA